MLDDIPVAARNQVVSAGTAEPCPRGRAAFFELEMDLSVSGGGEGGIAFCALEVFWRDRKSVV